MENKISLHELIEKYDFSELNQEQQQFVLLEITKEEYAELRKTIALTTGYFENEPIFMGEDLVVPKIKVGNVVLKIINYKLPIYKIAAIFVVVSCIDNLLPEELSQETQISEASNDVVPDTNSFLAYNRYTSNNSIKYDTGLSGVYASN
tara:strand:- start:1673 stop:2119 length:447 start_codon:yes stop_codon:yes gene_type:complete